ncbi:MAG: lactate utilization protein [Deltaproteobacteria bacterium]|nr:MAG: lactate utilization protein [Deltaproteobacteria bacterium]
MITSGEKQFISNVRAALGHAPHKKRAWSELSYINLNPKTDERLAKIKNRTPQESQELLLKLIQQSEPLGFKVFPFKDKVSVAVDIVRIIREKQPEWGGQKFVTVWKHPLIDSLNLVQVLNEQNILVPVYYTELECDPQNEESAQAGRQRIKNNISDSFIGVTSADFCLADTATLVMKTRLGQARAVSLVPYIHIAVIEKESIIADLKELYALLKSDDQNSASLTNCLTFITGPSKTADIEGVMVHGAHGPREIYLYVITG